MINYNDVDIYFTEPETPSQGGLNEQSNALLRQDKLPKKMDFNEVENSFIQSITSKRNNIPRKSLNYKIPLEVFLSYVDYIDFFLLNLTNEKYKIKSNPWLIIKYKNIYLAYIT